MWDEGGDSRNPFSTVLVSPLFANPSTLNLIRRELKEKRGATVYFDSGGYYCQQGKISFDQLYRSLRDYYKDPANHWADWYVLPDYVPNSTDTPEIVEEKVSNTITAVRMFHAEIPSTIQEVSIPVIQGHTFQQVNQCMEAYKGLGFKYVGFGSFGTNGLRQDINRADRRSISILSHVSQDLGNNAIRLHTFGVSTPPVVYALKRLGVYSFDSLAWQRSAGYGKIYMPFTRAYNVSYQSTRNSILDPTEFGIIKERTGHWCPFCVDFRNLRESRLHRSLHNLVAVMETVDNDCHQNSLDIASLIKWKSQHYYKLFEKVYLR